MNGRAAAAAQLRVDVVDQLVAGVVGLDEATAFVLLDNVTSNDRGGVRRVRKHLQEHPDVFTSGAPVGPPTLFRLLEALDAAGLSVVVPVCSDCGQRKPLPEQVEGGRICANCASRRRARPCTRCGRIQRLGAIAADGPVCISCYAKDPARREPCARCGHHRKVQHRLADGGALCSSCHHTPTKICVVCSRTAEVAKRGPDGPLCAPCYERTARPVRQCGRCGEIRSIVRRATPNSPDLCRRCHPEPIRTCVQCGRERPCRRVAGGPALCGTCRTNPLATCARCGQSKPVMARWPLGNVCHACYRHARAHPGPCSSCGQTRVLIATGPDGESCGRCAGSARTYQCSSCNGSEELYQDGRCVRCVLTDRLHAQFSIGAQTPRSCGHSSMLSPPPIGHDRSWPG